MRAAEENVFPRFGFLPLKATITHDVQNSRVIEFVSIPSSSSSSHQSAHVSDKFLFRVAPTVKSAGERDRGSESEVSAWSREVCYVLEGRWPTPTLRRLTRSSPFPAVLSREAKYLPGELSAETERQEEDGYARRSCFAISTAACLSFLLADATYQTQLPNSH